MTETQIQSLSDDYVKFIGYAQLCIDRSGFGIVALITNNNFQSATTFRDMRAMLSRSFNLLHIIDLHGNSRLKEVGLSGETDENVFDILPGVCISLMGKNGESNVVRRKTDVFGPRNFKYHWLSQNTLITTQGTPFTTTPPHHLFLHVNTDSTDEYVKCYFLPEMFGTGNYQNDKTKVYGSGFKTQQDQFAIGFTVAELTNNINILLSPATTEAQVRSMFTMCSTNQWSFDVARNELNAIDWKKLVTACLYRPFDIRFTVLHRAVVSNPRTKVMSQFLRRNRGLCVGRQGQAIPGEWNIVFCTRMPEDQNLFYRGGNTNFPLYWTEGPDELDVTGAARCNLSRVYLRHLSEALGQPASRETALPIGVTAEDVFNYVYAVLYSPNYRSRYAEFLTTDFPRVPLPRHLEVFRVLAGLGGELVALHLMESSRLRRPITIYNGPKDPEVARVSWSDDTVWLDAATTRKSQAAASGTIGFRGVPEAVWNFHIGGYQVCEKWLKDRKGRRLSEDDLAHYQTIVVALSETIRLMQEIDEVIEQHGGWPAAFAQGGRRAPEAPSASEVVPLPPRKPSISAPKANPSPRLEPAEPEAPPCRAEGGRESRATGLDPDRLDREELICSIRRMFSDGEERAREAATEALALELGCPRSKNGIEDELDKALRSAVRRGILTNERGALSLFARTITQYDRNFLKEQFLASLPGRRWTERDDAIRAFARWMGFRRTGRSIDETGRSLINGLLREKRLERDGSQIRRSG